MNENPQPVLDPKFWRSRLNEAGQDIRLAVFHCNTDLWDEINRRHRKILEAIVKPEDSILDAGCAYGRLLDLLPETWNGDYLGIDLSPDFISVARERYPKHEFTVCNLKDFSTDRVFDLAILVSIKYTIIGNCGQELWDEVEKNLKKYCKRLVFLEFDKNEEPDYKGITQ